MPPYPFCSVCSCVMLHSECVAAAKPLNKNPCFFPFPQNSHMRPSPPQQPVSQPSPHPQPPPPHSQMLQNQVRKLNNTKLKICTFSLECQILAWQCLNVCNTSLALAESFLEYKYLALLFLVGCKYFSLGRRKKKKLQQSVLSCNDFYFLLQTKTFFVF